MKYRKKPVTAEAVQWWKMGDHPAVSKTAGSDLLHWLGDEPVRPGDWIITQDGRHSVVSAEEFAREVRTREGEPMNPRLSIYVLIFMAIYARNHNAPFEEMAFAAMAILECFLAWIEDKHAELAAEIAALNKETP